MGVFALHLKDEFETLSLENLPCYQSRDGQKTDLQIARHLAHVLKAHGRPSTLYLPTALALSGFYHCPVVEVLKGLQALKKLGHDYQLHSLDSNVTLCDSLHKPSKGIYKALKN